MSLEKYPADRRRFSKWLQNRRDYKSAVDANGFRLGDALRCITGPVIEVNGPSAGGYNIIGNRLPSTPIISNIKHHSTQAVEAPHILADATRLPFADRSIGMVLVRGLYIARPQSDDDTRSGVFSLDLARQEYTMYPELPEGQTGHHNLRIEAIEEAARVLQTGGLLVWASGGIEDLAIAEAKDFELCRSREYLVSYGAGATGTVVDAVFRQN